MTNNILIVCEEREGTLRKVSYELVTVANELAKSLGGAVHAAILGCNVAANAQAIATSGVAQVYAVDDSALALFAPETYTTALAEIIGKSDPSIVLFGATGFSKELGARVAARLGWGLAADCINIKMDNGTLTMTRPIYAGKAIATVQANSLPVMASIRPNIFAAASGNTLAAPIENVAVSLPTPRARVIEKVKKEAVAVDLAEAKIVVSGGRGVKDAQGFEIVKQLASTLGAAVGASRAAVDAGWIDYSTQVGQTGKTVAPQLYIAAGISGAIQHIAGMSSSKVIVAVNKDPDAPIFQIADYGIVGDLFQVLPILNQELKQVLAEK